MTIFERVKAGVSLRAAAERYGFKITGNNMICCPFHNDCHPSMKLNDDYFYCFSCGATGDVISFVGKIFDDNSYEEAQRLAKDFNIETDKPLSSRIKPKYPKDKAFHADEIYCLRVLCDCLHTLEDWKVRYAPQSTNEEYHERFVEACQMLECAVQHLPIYLDRIYVRNGTYFLNGKFTEKKTFCRNRLPIAYDPKAWLRFLSELLNYEDIPTLQEFMGYCLIPSTKGQKMLILTGKGGEGKSRIGIVLKALLGANMNMGSIAKIETSPFARADLEHELVLLDNDMKLEALPQTNNNPILA